MYNEEELKLKVLQGTYRILVNKGAPKNKILSQNDHKRIIDNLKDLSDKELLFLKMVDNSNLQPIYNSEIERRNIFKPLLTKLHKMVESLAEHRESDSEKYVAKLAMRYDVDERVVGYLDLSLKENKFARVEESEIENKIRELLVRRPDIPFLELILHIEQHIASIPKLLEVLHFDNINIEQSEFREVSVDDTAEILQFVQMNTRLEIEELIYLLSSVYQLTSGQIKHLLDESK